MEVHYGAMLWRDWMANLSVCNPEMVEEAI
jgi:hypothetical protein